MNHSQALLFSLRLVPSFTASRETSLSSTQKVSLTKKFWNRSSLSRVNLETSLEQKNTKRSQRIGISKLLATNTQFHTSSLISSLLLRSIHSFWTLVGILARLTLSPVLISRIWRVVYLMRLHCWMAIILSIFLSRLCSRRCLMHWKVYWLMSPIRLARWTMCWIPIISELGCPTLSTFDTSQFEQFPGATGADWEKILEWRGKWRQSFLSLLWGDFCFH